MERWLCPSRQGHLSSLPYGWTQRCPPSGYLSSSEGSRRVQHPQVVDASSSPSKFEAFEAVLGSSLVVFPEPPAWHCLWSCFSWSMFWGARRLPPVYQWGTVVAIHLCWDRHCRCQVALSSCRLPRSPEGHRPQLTCLLAHHAPLRFGLVPLSIGRPVYHE
jgi:hypothetical protein